MANVSEVKYKHLWATDMDKNSCKTYGKNIPCAKIICQDVRQIKLKNFERIGKMDVLPNTIIVDTNI